jgi:hypothetical protein
MGNELGGPLGELLAAMIPRIAAKTHRRYPGVPKDDMEQEMWLRAVEIGPQLRELHAEGREKKIHDRLLAAAKRIGREDERYRRACRAVALGYAVEDEQYYSLGLLRVLLPQYVDGGVADAPPKGRSDGPRRPSDDAEGNTYLCMMIDIDAAMSRVQRYHRDLLTRYFSLPQGDSGDELFARQQMASSMGLTYDALRQRVGRALQALQDELGGASPWR